jgi:molybdenum cofactor biosynthesis protein B
MGVEEHKEQAAELGPMECAVLSISDSRTEADDLSGKKMQKLLAAAGHRVAFYRLIKNDPVKLSSIMEELLAGQVHLILTTGGTGLSQRDRTIETLTPLLEKVLPGFGEIFRWLSYQQIGSAALLSRALLGLVRGKVVVCLPGSPQAVELALRELIIPEIKHLIWEAKK